MKQALGRGRLPTLGLGANLALRDAASLLDRLSAAARGEADLVSAIGAYEQEMRDYVYPFMRMTMEHDKQFGAAPSKDAGRAHARPPGRAARGPPPVTTA